MRPRYQVALLYLTMPIWFIPALLYIGWDEAGRQTIKDIPMGLRYTLTGKSPTF